jgi:hypothetical protein
METRQQQYRKVSAAAVASLLFGLLSLLTVFHWSLAALPLAGVFFCWLAFEKLSENPGELTGRPLAIAGAVTSVLFGILGSGWLLFAYTSEVPAGCQRVTYKMLQPDPENEKEIIPPAAIELEGKRVFIKGYMYPGRQQVGLKEFELCPAVPDCNFCTKDPSPTEMIFVRLEGDRVTRYTPNIIGIGGYLRVNSTPGARYPYTMDVNHIR